MAEAARDLSRLRIDRAGAPRSGRAGWIAFLALVILGAAWIGWREWSARGDDAPEVSLGRVERRGGAPAQSGVAANGYVVARRRAALSTDIQGRIVELPVEEGDGVKAGDVVARLDTRQLEAERARARAELERARAAVELARLEEQRFLDLAKGGNATDSEVDTARTAVKEAEAVRDALSAALDAIQVRIEKSSVFAPFAGVIVEKNAEVGEVVSAVGATGPNARGAVATLVDFDTLEVQVELSQTSLAAARVGAPVHIFLDAWPEDAYRGRVRQIWPTADRQKATVELRVEFLNRDHRILPEMGVRVVFVAGDEKEATPPEVLLPAEALAGGEEGGEPHVFLFRDGAVERRAITLDGRSASGRLRVKSGLVGNELVVLAPPASLRDGDPVQRRKERR